MIGKKGNYFPPRCVTRPTETVEQHQCRTVRTHATKSDTDPLAQRIELVIGSAKSLPLQSRGLRRSGCEDGGMTNAAEPVLHLWRALAKRDWEAVKTVVSDDCIFLDVPLGPTLAARGPDDIVKRLKGGLENENLADWANHDVRSADQRRRRHVRAPGDLHIDKR